jgi:hypothetical protein
MLKKILFFLFILISFLSAVVFAETINVQIKGIDDGTKTTKQQDYKEAVLFAKREAIERAGVNIKSMTTVKDMMVESDYIETQAEAVLMPGYNVVDIGYAADGTYQIVLIGKVKASHKTSAENIEKTPTAIQLTGEWKFNIEGYDRGTAIISQDGNSITMLHSDEDLEGKLIGDLMELPDGRYTVHHNNEVLEGKLIGNKIIIKAVVDTMHGSNKGRYIMSFKGIVISPKLIKGQYRYTKEMLYSDGYSPYEDQKHPFILSR